jgi:hypothetical protein
MHSTSEFHAVILDQGELYHIDPADDHFPSATKRQNYVMYRVLDFNFEVAGSCGSIGRTTNVSAHPITQSQVRQLLTPDPWVGCYPGNTQTHDASVGIAIDYGAYKVLGSNTQNVQTFLSGIFATSNLVYLAQPNINLSLKRIILSSSPSASPSWNQNPSSKACPSIEYLSVYL